MDHERRTGAIDAATYDREAEDVATAEGLGAHLGSNLAVSAERALALGSIADSASKHIRQASSRQEREDEEDMNDFLAKRTKDVSKSDSKKEVPETEEEKKEATRKLAQKFQTAIIEKLAKLDASKVSMAQQKTKPAYTLDHMDNTQKATAQELLDKQEKEVTEGFDEYKRKVDEFKARFQKFEKEILLLEEFFY